MVSRRQARWLATTSRRCTAMDELASRGRVGPGNALRTHLPRLVAVILVAAAFGITAGRSLSLELQAQPPVWVINAIPAALSELYFGHPKRYTILATVRERYFDSLPERN